MVMSVRPWWCFALIGIFVAAPASAQQYPTKVVRIVTSEPGSTTDILARVAAQGLTPALGRQVIVDNRGTLGADHVAKSPPDGYTILFYGSSVWTMQFFRKLSYDPVKDLAPISVGMAQAIVLVIHPALPVKNVKELVALAKARPGELNYGAGSVGATPHLAMELFKHIAKVDITRVAYKGTGPATLALLSGEVQVMFTGAGSVMPSYVKQGKMRAIAVSTAQPTPLTPGLPTVNASGLPGYEFTSVAGFFAPAGTPQPIINLLSQEISKVLARQDVKDQFASSGVDVYGTTPEEFGARVKADVDRWGKVIAATGMNNVQ
jgi:tripartite-type tricarboxylate transporter receptor subunit TctC